MAEASYPAELLYHPEHDWVRIDPADPSEGTFGITWYAQDTLGDVVFWEPPLVGMKLVKDEPYAEVESVKAVSDVVAPLSGEIVAVNKELANEPHAINDDPYGAGWLVKVRLSEPAEQEALMSRDAYVESLGGGAGG